MGGSLHEFSLKQLVFFVVAAQAGHLAIHLVPFGLRIDYKASFEDVTIHHETMLEYTAHLLSQTCRKHQAPLGVDFAIVFSEQI
jgi:hypothetical protein